MPAPLPARQTAPHHTMCLARHTSCNTLQDNSTQNRKKRRQARVSNCCCRLSCYCCFVAGRCARHSATAGSTLQLQLQGWHVKGLNSLHGIEPQHHSLLSAPWVRRAVKLATCGSYCCCFDACLSRQLGLYRETRIEDMQGPQTSPPSDHQPHKTVRPRILACTHLGCRFCWHKKLQHRCLLHLQQQHLRLLP